MKRSEDRGLAVLNVDASALNREAAFQRAAGFHFGTFLSNLIENRARADEGHVSPAMRVVFVTVLFHAPDWNKLENTL